MVQKYSAPVRVYKYPFELVMAAYEKRFPTCHLIPVFVGSDKIQEDISEDGSVHVIERRCIINVDAPYLLRKITGVDHVLFIQKNTLDRRKRILKIEAWNESFSNHINIHELCFYKANNDNDNWTSFEQQASLEVKSFWGFEHVVEKLAVKHYSQNVKKGEEIIEFHISELAQEGVTFIPPFDQNLTSNHSSALDISNGDDPEDDDDYSHSNSNYSRDQYLCDRAKNGLLKSDKASTNGCLHSSLERDSFRSNSLDENSGQTMLNSNGRNVVSSEAKAKFSKDSSNPLKKGYSLQSPS